MVDSRLARDLRLTHVKPQFKFLDFVACNLCQSFPTFTILVLYGLLLSLVFFYLKICEILSGFVQFKGNFVDGQNNLKYCDRGT